MIKRLGMILGMFGVILSAATFREGIAANKASVDLYAEETNVSEIGFFDMVEAEVYAVLDVYATEVTTENGVKKDEDNCYIIPAFNGEETYYIGVKVNDQSYTDFDRIMDNTYDYLMGYAMDLGDVTVHTQGCLKKMSSKMQGYYYDWFREAEWFESEADMEKYALPLYIDTIYDTGFMKYGIWVGIALALIGGGLFIYGWKNE